MVSLKKSYWAGVQPADELTSMPIKKDISVVFKF